MRRERTLAVVAPPDAVELDLPFGRGSRADVRRRLSALPSGTPIVLCASGRLSPRRTRRLLRETGMDVAREYLAFPSASVPVYLVEDDRAAIRYFSDSALVAPPGSGRLVRLGVGTLRALRSPRLLGRVAPGRVVTGRMR
jgi:hypothetical protein